MMTKKSEIERIEILLKLLEISNNSYNKEFLKNEKLSDRKRMKAYIFLRLFEYQFFYSGGKESKELENFYKEVKREILDKKIIIKTKDKERLIQSVTREILKDLEQIGVVSSTKIRKHILLKFEKEYWYELVKQLAKLDKIINKKITEKKEIEITDEERNEFIRIIDENNYLSEIIANNENYEILVLKGGKKNSKSKKQKWKAEIRENNKVLKKFKPKIVSFVGSDDEITAYEFFKEKITEFLKEGRNVKKIVQIEQEHPNNPIRSLENDLKKGNFFGKGLYSMLKEIKEELGEEKGIKLIGIEKNPVSSFLRKHKLFKEFLIKWQKNKILVDREITRNFCPDNVIIGPFKIPRFDINKNNKEMLMKFLEINKKKNKIREKEYNKLIEPLKGTGNLFQFYLEFLKMIRAIRAREKNSNIFNQEIQINFYNIIHSTYFSRKGEEIIAIYQIEYGNTAILVENNGMCNKKYYENNLTNKLEIKEIKGIIEI